MSDVRGRIIKNIQSALQHKSESGDVDGMFAALTTQQEYPVQPELPGESGSAASLVAVFIRAAANSSAEVHSIQSSDQLPGWVRNRAEQLKEQPSLMLSPQFGNSPSNWSPMVLVGDDVDGPGPGCWGLAKGFAGIAETGTVVSLSTNCPSGLLFLVERLIVVLDRVDIFAYQEDVWNRLRALNKGRLPRAVNLVTGPSRTADVEQQIQIGAHGPKWTDYLIVG